LLAKRATLIQPSATLAVSAKAKELVAQGKPVIGFGAGEPDFDTPQHIKQAAVEALEKGDTKYTAVSGTPRLKAAIAAWVKNDLGLDYAPGDVVVSCGAKHSLYNIFMAVCQEGDEVIIPSPFWLSYPEMVGLAGATGQTRAPHHAQDQGAHSQQPFKPHRGDVDRRGIDPGGPFGPGERLPHHLRRHV
jgi:aspartate aminotransferase